jgi:hypothetical protein
MFKFTIEQGWNMVEGAAREMTYFEISRTVLNFQGK